MTATHAVLEEVSPARKAEETGPGRGRRRIGGPMAPVEIRDLSKHFGAVAAVNDLSFDSEPGRVTGFLGPNGAGKSTTLRALLGLVQPSSGAATFGGLRYDELDEPSARVGAVLEDASFHPGRSARNTCGSWPSRETIPPPRRGGPVRGRAQRRRRPACEGLLDGHASAAGDRRSPARGPASPDPRRAEQRPGPARDHLAARSDARAGGKRRTVLISSHVLAEVAQSVDDVVVIADGELRAHNAGRRRHRRRAVAQPGRRCPARPPRRLHRRADTQPHRHRHRAHHHRRGD